jgi:uncharacterized membrane protein YoaK (UPF0700 family)
VTPAVPARPAAGPTNASLRHPLTRGLVALTFTTGVVDAVSYLGLGRVFTANMTGNVVLLGFGIVGGFGLPVLAPIVSLLAFLVGSAVGGELGRRLGDRHAVHISVALVIEVVLIAVCAVLTAAVTVHRNAFSGDAVIALLAFAMGVRNATVRRLAVPDLTTTVLTMTLTGLAADSRIAGGDGAGSARRIVAVVAMFAGACAGAGAVKASLTLALSIAAALALVTWVLYVPAAVRAARG